MSNKNAHVLVGGVFNCGNIEWSTMQVPERVPNRRVQCQLLEIAQEHCLAKVVNIHTREDKTLDLFLTNSPSLVNRVRGMPPIGKADHDIVYVEYDIKAKRIQQAPRYPSETAHLDVVLGRSHKEAGSATQRVSESWRRTKRRLTALTN